MLKLAIEIQENEDEPVWTDDETFRRCTVNGIITNNKHPVVQKRIDLC
ncbi:MAG: hypothetical protein HOM16_16695 [Woeseia sp.]|nr:hypothetical protein [Woeseia sp.]